MSSRKIEMLWTCSSCGTKNRGRDKVCPQCGDPKDASEKWEMPGDTRAAPTVTDPELLKKASAGADWPCMACGSNQSALGAACTQCGAPRPGAAPPRAPSAGDDEDVSIERALFRATLPSLPAIGASLVLAVLCVGLVYWWSLPRDVAVTVARVAWAHTVQVERYASRDQEGFEEARPTDAFDVAAQGQRHHHDEDVLDHYRTEHYTERVQDGYDQESYTEQVACGEDCSYSAPTCSESCTSDDNGFATCTETCWGGGESCTTRYCSETRYRDVPRYRDEPRTREVPVYRQEPRYAEWYAWRAWRWQPEREHVARGETIETRWPDEAEVGLRAGLAQGEDERASRRASYEVWFREDEGAEHAWTAPDLETFARFGPGTAHVLRLDGSRILEVDPVDR